MDARLGRGSDWATPTLRYRRGNPQAIAELQPGEHVLDLGSGAGFDAFLAARQVGASGSVIGVDGGGKTSAACATAIRLADAGKRVLLVSTDPASNLDEVLGVTLDASPKAVPGVTGSPRSTSTPNRPHGRTASASSPAW